MTDLTITHTAAEGTLIDGTSRGDGTAPILKRNGWRWGRSLGLWYIPRTRDTAANQPKINATSDALRQAGFTVDIHIDDTRRDRATIEADLAARGRERADRLSQRAARHQSAGDAADERADQLSERFYMGQPILTDHHSARGALRDQEKMHAATRRAIDEHAAAERDATAADTARARGEARHAPVTVANRIAKLETDIRRVEAQRDRTGFYRQYDDLEYAPWSPQRLEAFADELQRLRQDLEYWQGIRAEQLKNGETTNYSKETVHPGDLVKISGIWWRVVRANGKSVTVDNPDGCGTRAPWHQVENHKPTAD